MTEPEWYTKAKAEGRILSETGIGRGLLGTVTKVAGTTMEFPGAAYAPHVDVPVPPSTNNLYVNRAKGRSKSSEYRDWIASVEGLVMQLRPLAPGPFSIAYTLVGGSDLNLGRDLGNIEKPLTDVLVRTKRINNDSLRAGLHEIILRFVESDEGAAYVRIETRRLT